MRFLSTETDSPEQITAALTQGNSLELPEVEATVRGILKEVRERGDAAVRECLRRYDGVDLGSLEATPGELAFAEGAVEPEFLAAIDLAIRNVRRFHEQQVPQSWRRE